MNPRGLHYLLVFLSFITAIGLACATLTSTPTAEPQPTSPPSTQASADTASTALPPQTVPTDSSVPSDSSAPATFTDQNKLYAIDVPGDWTHTTGTDTNLYWDHFEAPDQHAFIENIVFDDGTPWTGGSNGKGALYLLNNTYSNTGKEGDIRISDDKIQKDGSERLTWTSKSGNYSGVSFFEVRNRTTFLMFTLWWDNEYEDAYRDMLNGVIASYRTP